MKSAGHISLKHRNEQLEAENAALHAALLRLMKCEEDWDCTHVGWCDGGNCAWCQARAALISTPGPAPVQPLPPLSAQGRIYPCADCGLLRSRAEGGTVFSVCEACWDRHHQPPAAQPKTYTAERVREALSLAGNLSGPMRLNATWFWEVLDGAGK